MILNESVADGWVKGYGGCLENDTMKGGHLGVARSVASWG